MSFLKTLFTPVRMAILVLLFLSLGVFLYPKNVEDPTWPLNETKALEVPLTFAWARITGEQRDLSPRTEPLNLAPTFINPEPDAVIPTLRNGIPDEVGILDRYVYLRFDDVTVRAQMPFPASGFIQELTARTQTTLTIFENPNFQATLSDRLFQILPLILLMSLLLFFLGRGATKSLGLTSAFDIIKPENLTETFDNVAGIDKARENLDDIVAFLKDPKAAGKLGARMPKGVLFAGPPGTGKTLLARAMAKEAGVPFIAIEASGVNQIFVGAGAMKIRRAFREARNHAPCIIFIDEIDAMGRKRGGSGPGGNDEKETTLNALLVELDGFDSREGIVLIAATNRPDVLDPALIRRGRVDRRVDVTLPSVEDREAILRVHMKKIKTDENLAIPMARQTFGMAGADLAAMVNEAALIATKHKQETVTLEDFLQARDRLMIGQSSGTVVLSDQEKEITAGHEAGHALVAALTPGADPIERVTIVPQGQALGFVMQLPTEDRKLMTLEHLNAKLDVAVAGRLAESMLFGPQTITTGAESDIQVVTSIARNMVLRWGMSDKGFVRIDEPLDPLHKGAHTSGDAMESIIQASIGRATALMTTHLDQLKELKTMLLEKETLTREDVLTLLGMDCVPLLKNGTHPPLSGHDT